MAAGNNLIQSAVEQSLLQTAMLMENEIDSEIDKLEKMDSDDLEKLRYLIKGDNYYMYELY